MRLQYHSRRAIVKKIIRIPVVAGLLILSAFVAVDTAGAQLRGQSDGPAAAPSGYRLIGTVEGEGFTGAVLDDATGIQVFYYLYEKLPDGSQVVKVRNNSIVLKKTDGVSYELFTANKTGTAAQARQVNAGTVAPAAVPADGTGGINRGDFPGGPVPGASPDGMQTGVQRQHQRSGRRHQAEDD